MEWAGMEWNYTPGADHIVSSLAECLDRTGKTSGEVMRILGF
jgi:hypothetical protein